MNLLPTSVCSLSSCMTSSLGDMIHHMPAPSRARWTSGVMAPSHINLALGVNYTEIIDRVNEAINAGLAEPKIKAQLAELGGVILPGSPADFGKLIAEET